jgi:REP element-mobilizing transposase RayT
MEMELTQRKPTRLVNFDYSQNGAYFITICTQDRKKILSDIVGDDAHIVPKIGGKIAENLIGEIPKKYPSVTVDKYTVMLDHIHILLRIDTVGEAFRLPENVHDGTGNPSPTIGTIIGWYKYQATKQINSMQNTSGYPVFQRSYYDHVIRNQRDYDEIWEYIENNPAKWLQTHCQE